MRRAQSLETGGTEFSSWKKSFNSVYKMGIKYLVQRAVKIISNACNSPGTYTLTAFITITVTHHLPHVLLLFFKDEKAFFFK